MHFCFRSVAMMAPIPTSAFMSGLHLSSPPAFRPQRIPAFLLLLSSALPTSTSTSNSFSAKESFEKSIVTWDTGSSCRRCKAGYSFTKSKTHCRLCG